MKILYITFADFNIKTSGSSVRPQKIYEAFLKNGHQVILVKGDDFITHDNSEHKKSVAEANAWLDHNTPDICYVENATHPLFLKEDRRLIKRVHDMGVPVGYFYRDFYYRYPEMYGPGEGLRNKLIYHYTLPLFKRDEKFVAKYADILYMPSRAACGVIPHPDPRELPPAGEIMDPPVPESRMSLYIGGIATGYGFGDMLEAYDILNGRGDGEYPLSVVCRAAELPLIGKTEEELIKEHPYLTIAHASGEELNKYYDQAAVCMVPKENDPYNDLAVSVKLYEYFSHGKPFIARPGKASVGLFKDSGAAIFAKDYTIEAMAEAVRDFFKDPERMKEMHQAALRFISEGNTWEDRAKQICHDLSNISEKRGKKIG